MLDNPNYSAKARNLLSIKPCVLKPKYKKLFAGHTEKLKKYVKFGEDVANTTGVLKLIDRLGDYKGIRNKLESFNDNALKSKFLNDFAESGDEIWKKLDANDGKLVDSWKILDDVGIDNLANKLDDIRFLDDYLSKNSGKVVENITAEIKSKGWKKWMDDPNGSSFKGIDPKDIAARLNSKKKIIQNATPEELEYIYKNEFSPSGIQDPSATKLNERFGGQSGMKFKNDPSGKEFDHITDELLIEHKVFTTESSSSIGQKVRTEYQVHFLASKTTNRKAYFIFEGNSNPAHVSKIKEYAGRYNVPTTIEENGKIIFKTE